MSQAKKKQHVSKPIIKEQIKMPAAKPLTTDGPLTIKYPLLWLALAVLVVYFPTFSFGLTELDDSIFIKDFKAYNEDLSHLFTSFTRGLFDATKDPYYRPIFADSMILNYKLSGESIAGYHAVNVLLHIGCVLLLYKLFTKLNVKSLTAFLLALVFAVHPVLTQAVSWIPGRNDTLLALFTFAFLICVIDFADKGKVHSILLSVLFLLLAFFTKETAVFAAPAAFVLLILVLQKKWLSPNSITLYATWVGCFVIWFMARRSATIQPANINAGNIFTDFIHRLPLIWQYLGKIFLPVNLSVFPILRDTSDVPGILVVVLLMACIVAMYITAKKETNWRQIGAGILVFILFLLPALLVPNNLNEQSFEHRLYLPMAGVLLMLPQVFRFNKIADKTLLTGGVGICVLLALVNYVHQRNFKDALSFWTAAAKTSPHSAYANMMLGARSDDLQTSYALFRKAYQLNPKEKYLNFYYGKMLQMQDSVLASEPHLLAEKNSSGYYECDFYLARVAMMKKDTTAAVNYLKTFLNTDPASESANINLLLIYYNRQQIPEAAAQARRMLQMGQKIPPQMLQQLHIK